MSCITEKDALFAALYGSGTEDCAGSIAEIKRNAAVLAEITDAKNFRIAYQTADGEWKRLRVPTKSLVEMLRTTATMTVNYRLDRLVPRVVDNAIDEALNALVDKLNA